MWIDGFRLALTTFTVAPIPAPGRVDRAVAGWSMRFAPFVGALLGAALAALLIGLRELLPALLAAALTVGAGAILTRGLHLDGVADTVDALGSYLGRERALAIMKSPEVGPFGVLALVFVVLLQSAALTAVSPWAMVVATAAGRLAATWACRRGVASARPDGLGALVAGTVGPIALALNTLAVAALAVLATPERPWQGPIVVIAALGLAAIALRHAIRRLGGITGDVLGFLIELTATVVLIGLSI